MRRSRLGFFLGLTSLAVAGWLFAQLMHRRTGFVHWDHADQIGSFFSVAFTVHVCLEFVGKTREFRGAAWGVWSTTTPLICASALGPWMPFLRAWPGSFSWSVLVGIYGLGWMLFSMVIVLAHRARQSDPEERARAAVLFGALFVNTSSAMLDLTKGLGLPRPDLGHLGTMAGTMLTASVVLQTAPSEGSRVTVFEGLSAAAIATVAVTAVHTVFTLAGDEPALVALSLSCLATLLAGTVRWLLHNRALRRERSERHLLLGRMTEQLTHDLKNPLAALRGAIELIERRVTAGVVLTKDDKMLTLLRPQVDRIEGVLQRYLRTASVVPILSEGDLGLFVRDAVAALGPSLMAGVELRVSCVEEPSRVWFDPELIGSVLDNVLRNAQQAMPKGGVLTVSVTLEQDRDIGDASVISVTDSGVGMDPRVLARAGEDFFTTKPEGSGLGLSFVRRVAVAHGGKLALDSRLGHGTTVRIVLPNSKPPPMSDG